MNSSASSILLLFQPILLSNKNNQERFQKPRINHARHQDCCHPLPCGGDGPCCDRLWCMHPVFTLLTLALYLPTLQTCTTYKTSVSNSVDLQNYWGTCDAAIGDGGAASRACKKVCGRGRGTSCRQGSSLTLGCFVDQSVQFGQCRLLVRYENKRAEGRQQQSENVPRAMLAGLDLPYIIESEPLLTLPPSVSDPDIDGSNPNNDAACA